MSKIRKRAKLILKKDLVIPAGTEFTIGPRKTEWHEPNFQATLGPHKNSVIYITIGQSDLLDFLDTEGDLCAPGEGKELLPELFEIVR